MQPITRKIKVENIDRDFLILNRIVQQLKYVYFPSFRLQCRSIYVYSDLGVKYK